MKLSVCMHDFFDRYLQRIRGASKGTIRAYREALGLFLRFCANQHETTVAQLRLEHITVEVVCGFLDHLERERGCGARTRNQRLAALKAFAKMLLLLYPEHRDLAEQIRGIPAKRTQKRLVGFLTDQEVAQVFDAVDLNAPNGFRNYALLHLLYNSGARASEAAAIALDALDVQAGTLGIIGKGDRFRIVPLWPKTTSLLTEYITSHRTVSKPLHRHWLFVNQRGEGLSRHGIHRLCANYLKLALPARRLQDLSPAHSFRHACAVRLLATGWSLTDIKNFLGHENIQSTMVYLKLDLRVKRQAQQRFIELTGPLMKGDAKIDELIEGQHKAETLKWLDNL